MSEPDWSLDPVADLSDLRVLITGATSGIGLETARALAERGATVIIGARDDMKADHTIRSIRSGAPEAQISSFHLDLASLESIRQFVYQVSEQYAEIDLLINNAGVMLLPYGVTDDGFELHFGTNHLGHFALTGLLLPTLERSTSPRIVTVASLAHREATLDLDDLHDNDGATYQPMAAYRRSKLANLVFGYELDRRLRAAGMKGRSFAAHPGLTDTNLANHLADRLWWKVVRPTIGVLIQNPDAGALPTIRAGLDPNLHGGEYVGPGRLRETFGAPVVVDSTPESHDPDLAEKLWNVSEELTGVRYL